MKKHCVLNKLFRVRKGDKTYMYLLEERKGEGRGWDGMKMLKKFCPN